MGMIKTIPVWDVQTFYGTKQKTFQKQYHAEAYKGKLIMMGYESDLVEIHKRNLTTEEFNMEYLED